MSGIEAIGVAASVVQLVGFCSRFHGLYTKFSDAPDQLLAQRRDLDELMELLQQLENSLPFDDVQGASILHGIGNDIRNLDIELDKVTPGPVDGKFRSCGKMFKCTFKLESIKSALDRLESRKNTLNMWVIANMFKSKGRDLLEIRDCNHGMKSLMNEVLSLSAQMSHLSEDLPRISQEVAAVSIDVPVVAAEVHEIRDELPIIRKMAATVECIYDLLSGNKKRSGITSKGLTSPSWASVGEEQSIERVDSLHNATECITPEKLFGAYLAKVKSTLESEDLQKGQLKLYKTGQLNPRSKSFDSPLANFSWGPHFPDNTPKDPPDTNIRNSPDLTIAVSRQSMINLKSSSSGIEGPLTADCTEDPCNMPILNSMDTAAQTLPTSTALQVPSRPRGLSCSSRDAQEKLFVLPSQPISIVIKDPSDGKIQTPRRSKKLSKPPSLTHSPCNSSRIKEPVFVRPGPIQPITVKEPVTGNVIDLPRLKTSRETSSRGRLCSDSRGPYQNLFAIPSSAKPITIKDPAGRKIETYVKRSKLWEALQAPGSGVCRIGNRNIAEGNKRLALIGDAVLRLALVELSYAGDESRGRAQQRVSTAASNRNLANVGRQHGIEIYINPAAGTIAVSDGTIADTMEAIIGAAYLDGGLPASRSIMKTLRLL